MVFFRSLACRGTLKPSLLFFRGRRKCVNFTQLCDVGRRTTNAIPLWDLVDSSCDDCWSDSDCDDPQAHCAHSLETLDTLTIRSTWLAQRAWTARKSTTSSLRRSLSSPPLVTGLSLCRCGVSRVSFGTFLRFQKKVRVSAASCGDDPPGGNFHAERSSTGSWRSRPALELMDAGGL